MTIKPECFLPFKVIPKAQIQAILFYISFITLDIKFKHVGGVEGTQVLSNALGNRVISFFVKAVVKLNKSRKSSIF